MRLCDSFVLDADDPRNRCRTGPLRAGTGPERLRCLRCAGWTPHGALPNPDRVTVLVREAISLLTELALEPKYNYRWAHGIALSPNRSGSNGRGSAHGDPTGNQTADPRRAVVRDCTVIAARLLERIVRDLRSADDAIGQALLAAEPPGPFDHTPAPYHDAIPPTRPDLEEPYAARGRRRARGEGVPQ